jgi:hypothetical protein
MAGNRGNRVARATVAVAVHVAEFWRITKEGRLTNTKIDSPRTNFLTMKTV